MSTNDGTPQGKEGGTKNRGLLGRRLVLGAFIALAEWGCSGALPRGESAVPDEASDASSGPTVLVGPAGALTFLPPSLTVPVGATVHWFWSSTGHNVISGVDGVPDGAFCSPNNTACTAAPTSSAGTTFEYTFTQPGTFPYYCSPHVGDGMKGTIVVK